MRIECLGAGREVTGSCFLVECGGRRILVDCGLIQGSPEAEARNGAPFPFDPGSVDAVVLTHAHLDHAGRIPQLVRVGFRGAIFTHRATCALARVMLMDAANLNERDAETTSRKRQRQGLDPVAPLYTASDAEAALAAFTPVEYDEHPRGITPGIAIRLRDAGHILGSAIVELWLSEGGTRRKVVFSGDLGHAGAPLMSEPAPVTEADFVFLESTYGARDHRSWDATRAELGGVIRQAREGGGNILVPAFAVGRTQTLLHLLLEHHADWGLNDWYTFLDSPMAIEATEVYESFPELMTGTAGRCIRRGQDPFAPPNLQLSRTPEDSMAINRMRSGALIIAGSGMCTGGRILHHLKHNLWRQEAHVIIVGYQAAGTLGRALVDGAEEVTLWGEPVRVGATIHTVGGLSAHAGRSELLDWYGRFAGKPPAALVHGEPAEMAGLAAAMEARFGVTPLMPERGTVIPL